MSPRTRARGRRRISYKEDISSSSDPSGQDTESGSDKIPIKKSSKPKSSRRSKSHTLPSRHKGKATVSDLNSRSARTNKSTHSTASVEPAEDENATLQLGGKVPKWQCLPYHILADVFYYASRPLQFHHLNVTSNVSWLLKCARLCKAFAEPALSALYYSPPLVPPARAQAFLKHLASQTGDWTINYRAKVRFLEIEATHVVIQRPSPRGIELPDLLGLTPQLQGLTLYLPSDWTITPIQPSNAKLRSIPQQLISDALGAHKIALRELEYTCSLMGRSTLPMFIEPNPNPYSHMLQSLTLTRYSDYYSTEEQLAIGLKNLPRLRRLSFISSSIVNQKLLTLLPHNLELFRVASCPNMTSKILSPFLATHGETFKQLILEHNEGLNLSFLGTLADCCPRLQTLGVDLTFYRSDRPKARWGPRFDALLGNEIPSWPASLERLELFHLRDWNLSTAERFFSSLVDSAASLPMLRHIDIKASLEESGWRDRVGFRDKWTSRLRGVFLRVSKPPNPLLKSIRVFEEHKLQSNKSNGLFLASKHQSNLKLLAPSIPPEMTNQPTEDFSHILIKKDMVKAKRDSPSDSDVPLATIRRSKRLKLNNDSQSGRSHHQSSSARETGQIKESDDDSSSKDSGAEYDGSYAAPKAPSATRRRTRRRKESDEGSSSEDSAIDDVAHKQISKPEAVDDAGQDHHVQGLCEVVHIIIDNLRPAGVHLNEDDFLDDEVSGDEDWNGDDEDEGDAGYAW